MNNYSYYISPPYELYHHGIKGQKWGVRRYQNDDGSLTSAGKQRYGSVGDRVKKAIGNAIEKEANRNAERWMDHAADVNAKRKAKAIAKEHRSEDSRKTNKLRRENEYLQRRAKSVRASEKTKAKAAEVKEKFEKSKSRDDAVRTITKTAKQFAATQPKAERFATNLVLGPFGATNYYAMRGMGYNASAAFANAYYDFGITFGSKGTSITRNALIKEVQNRNG